MLSLGRQHDKLSLARIVGSLSRSLSLSLFLSLCICERESVLRAWQAQTTHVKRTQTEAAAAAATKDAVQDAAPHDNPPPMATETNPQLSRAGTTGQQGKQWQPLCQASESYPRRIEESGA